MSYYNKQWPLILLASTAVPYRLISTQLLVILLKEKSDYITSLPSIYRYLPIILRIRFKTLTMASKST